MTDPTRVAGWGRLADGAEVTWTVAEGRRGRRWREVVAQGTTTRHALLLETDAGGWFSHLELARADGLWTFHPEPDATLHGNHVARGETGVQHVAGWPFHQGDALLIEGSPIALAALAWSLRTAEVGSVLEVPGIEIRLDGDLRRVPALAVERPDGRTWRIGDGSPFEVDADGLPVLDGGQRRPLEQA